jgi:hypothetical protein
LAAEAKTSKNPHYYLGDLADVEEKLGNEDRALFLYADAYAQAKGPASRFQWGFNYLSGLIRMRPDDTDSIALVGDAVLGELTGPDAVHRRARGRLEKLDAQIKAWNSNPARAAVAAKLHDRFADICAPGGVSHAPGDAATECPEFLRLAGTR